MENMISTAARDAFPPFFTHLQCNFTFSLWGVTASPSTAPLYFLFGKEEVSVFAGVRGWPFFVPLENPA